MPAFKKQHYLPAAYLKYFSSDQECCSRDSLLWRVDGKHIRHVPVESQCSSDYFYSKEKAVETEKMFQINENAYCDCIDKIRAGKELEGRNRGDLLLSAFDFHLRNAVHKNLTGKEGIEAYGMRASTFIGQVLFNDVPQEITKSDLIQCLTRYWRLEIISSPNNFNFITSDNPSVWITLNATKSIKRELHIVMLPLTPKHVAIGFDRRVLRILPSQASVRDVPGINMGQLQNANRAIYTSQPISPEQTNIAQEHLSFKTESPCEINEDAWKLLFHYLPPEHHFSFIRLQPPLL